MNDFLWVEKYRPKTIEECILPENIKKTFQEFVDNGEIPNLLLSGPPGIGKTTIAKALCNEIGADFYVINGSDEGRFLDTVRNQAKNFAATASLQGTGKHKVIIIDEADNTTHDVQLYCNPTLRRFITTVDSSSPATSKTESSNRSTLDVQSLISKLEERRNRKSLLSSSKDSMKSWIKKKLSRIRKFL